MKTLERLVRPSAPSPGAELLHGPGCSSPTSLTSGWMMPSSTSFTSPPSLTWRRWLEALQGFESDTIHHKIHHHVISRSSLMTLLLLASSQMGTTQSTEDLFRTLRTGCLWNNLQINAASKTKELVVDFRRRSHSPASTGEHPGKRTSTL
ncbi:hypothetical protein L3Q82_010465 [Scortum barcoo]|uniref:Uncharacterized protein n=1 Tax=Scortum barcoo TaxID=214431 RepID=A0ACB8WBW6_9TELE|nr:hypothetical protein L3Q82_010465 [Scortum barcoo]